MGYCIFYKIRMVDTRRFKILKKKKFTDLKLLTVSMTQTTLNAGSGFDPVSSGS